MTKLDLSGTSIFGDVSDTLFRFRYLRVLALDNTHLRSAHASLPAFVEAVPNKQIVDFENGFSCPQLNAPELNHADVSLDATYFDYALCSCSKNFFGVNGSCYACPSACRCEGNVISGCFPVTEYRMTPSAIPGVFYDKPLSVTVIPCVSSGAGV
jgi:hypothetical protein